MRIAAFHHVKHGVRDMILVRRLFANFKEQRRQAIRLPSLCACLHEPSGGAREGLFDVWDADESGSLSFPVSLTCPCIRWRANGRVCRRLEPDQALCSMRIAAMCTFKIFLNNQKQRTLPHIQDFFIVSYNCTQDTKDTRVKIVDSYL